MTSQYLVAGLGISVTLPENADAASLLPNFAPFVSGGQGCVLDVRYGKVEAVHDAEPLVVETNDMGRTEVYGRDSSWLFRIEFQGTVALMLLAADYASATVSLDISAVWAGHLLSSMIRTAFAQSILRHKGISLHASCVLLDGKGYLFMGKSGTGKSTHARLWMESFEGCSLLNDDNPMLRMMPDGELRVFGSPWSGKTACYRDLSSPVGGMVRLSQAPENKFVGKDGIEAFMEILPGCSALRLDRELYESLCDLLSEMVACADEGNSFRIGHLYCLPHPSAAILCNASLR